MIPSNYLLCTNWIPMNKFIILIFAIYSTSAVSDDVDCAKAINTIEINYCAGVKLANAEQEMNTYLSKSKE